MAHNFSATAASSRDPLQRSTAYQVCIALMPDCFKDCEQLVENPITVKLAAQLYAGAGSIKVNIAEGYSRSSGADRVRFYEYSLGSVRESMEWYRDSEPVLGIECVTDRLDRLEEIRRLLLATIPRERGKVIRKKSPRG
jgi:four helix bundle protein